MKKHTIKSLTDYISYVEGNCIDEKILFRGQQQDWPLVPKIGRLKLNKRLPPAELEMLQELIRTGHSYLNEIEPFSKGSIHIDVLVFAQHNGMATRLLDWTNNPLAALWFAVRTPPCKSKDDSLLDGVIWVYIPEGSCKQWLTRRGNPLIKGDVITMHHPSHVTPQISAQQAMFTIHGYDEDGNGFEPMEKHKPHCDYMTKIIVPAGKFSELRYQLDRCGINEASMFPGINGLCKHLEWYHSLLEDETGTETS